MLVGAVQGAAAALVFLQPVPHRGPTLSIQEDTSIAMRTGTPVRLALGALMALAAGAGADTWEQRQWARTTYYRTSFSAEEAVTGTLYAAAVDDYTLYLNGTKIGADSTWQRLQTWAFFSMGSNDMPLANWSSQISAHRQHLSAPRHRSRSIHL